MSGAGHRPRLVILDRDGVVNEDSDAYIKSPEEFRPYDASLHAIVRLKRAGKLVAIATNQSGIARGYFDEATLHAMHAKLVRLLDASAGASSDWIDYLRYCPHGPDDGCDCRKPRPGMLLQILEESQLAPEEALFVGDSLSDLQAAQAAGVPARLVRTGKGERSLARRDESPESRALLESVPVFADLPAAVADLVSISLDDD